jgi:hypothetical protein
MSQESKANVQRLRDAEAGVAGDMIYMPAVALLWLGVRGGPPRGDRSGTIRRPLLPTGIRSR